ncbi:MULTISPECIES: hypothetical protein [unclassified Pseudomonas]|uniref:hypothetical protein n=1 Tax=unclassified Pseudomonas TaxID=196821 RepID=UPI0011AF755D|nr:MULTISPECIES: hypothetical protein [unclassified Pseudomonas]
MAPCKRQSARPSSARTLTLIEDRKTDKEITSVVDVQQTLSLISLHVPFGGALAYGATFLTTAN